MRADFFDASCSHDDDLVGVLDSAEAVCDDEDGFADHDVVERGLHECFVFGVEGRGGLVQDEDVGVGEGGARDRQALALAAGQVEPARADHGVLARAEALHELLHVGCARDALHRLHVGLVRALRDVFLDRVFEEDRTLADHADALVQGRQVVLAQVAAVKEHRARRRVLGAHQQLRDRRLARARVADEGGHSARADLEAQSFEDGVLGPRGLRKPHVSELDRAFERGRRLAPADDVRPRVHELALLFDLRELVHQQVVVPVEPVQQVAVVGVEQEHGHKLRPGQRVQRRAGEQQLDHEDEGQHALDLVLELVHVAPVDHAPQVRDHAGLGRAELGEVLRLAAECLMVPIMSRFSSNRWSRFFRSFWSTLPQSNRAARSCCLHRLLAKNVPTSASPSLGSVLAMK